MFTDRSGTAESSALQIVESGAFTTGIDPRASAQIRGPSEERGPTRDPYCTGTIFVATLFVIGMLMPAAGTSTVIVCDWSVVPPR